MNTDESSSHIQAPRDIQGLILIDGLGIAPHSEANLLSSARLPNLEELVKTYPVLSLERYKQGSFMYGTEPQAFDGFTAMSHGVTSREPRARVYEFFDSGIYTQNDRLLQIKSKFQADSNKRLHIFADVTQGNTDYVQFVLHHVIPFLHKAGSEPFPVSLHLVIDPQYTLYLGEFLTQLHEKFTHGQVTICSVINKQPSLSLNAWEYVQEVVSTLQGTEPIGSFEYVMDALGDDGALGESSIFMYTGDRIQKGDVVLMLNSAQELNNLVKPFAVPSFPLADGMYVETYSMLPVDAALPISTIFFPNTKHVSIVQEYIQDGYDVHVISDSIGISRVEKEFLQDLDRDERKAVHVEVLDMPLLYEYEKASSFVTFDIMAQARKILEENRSRKLFFIIQTSHLSHMLRLKNQKLIIKALESIDKSVNRFVDMLVDYGGRCVLASSQGGAEHFIMENDWSQDNPVPCILIDPAQAGEVGPGGDVFSIEMNTLRTSGDLTKVREILSQKNAQ
jgi:bisphosphoglycerate-independent phosphoglycerate mutase (AlkP superfamily)